MTDMPTHQEKLAFIREKVIACNPEIVELKFGCQVFAPWRTHIVKHTVIFADRDKVYVAESRRRDEDFPNVGTTKKHNLENIKRWGIIGRPTTLADVLLALRTRLRLQPKRNLYIGVDGHFMVEKAEYVTHRFPVSVCEWNLLKTLEDQDEPTISFIYDVLN